MLVEIPERGIAEFPDEMPPEEVTAVIQRTYPELAPKQADLSGVKLDPYQQADLESMSAGRGKAETGMESGTELTTALVQGAGDAAAKATEFVTQTIPQTIEQVGTDILNAPEMARYLAGQALGVETEYQPAFKPGVPIIPPPEKTPITSPNQSPFIQGLVDDLASQISSLTTPGNIGTIIATGGTGVAGKQAATETGKVLAAYFGGLIGTELPGRAKQAFDVLNDPNATGEEKGAAVAQAGGPALLGALLVHSAAKTGAPKAEPKTPVEAKAEQIAPLAPLTAEALKQTAKEGGADVVKLETKTPEATPVQEAKSQDPLEADKARYRELDAQRSKMIEDGSAFTPDQSSFTPEYMATWKELETIKNRHGGMPPETAHLAKPLEATKAPPKENIPLGIERPDVENRALRILSEAEFDAEYRAAKKQVYESEKILDEVADTSDLTISQKQQLAASQDRWSSAELERLRRNYGDIHTEDIFRKMIDLADQGTSYSKFKVLADILRERGGAKESDVTGVYKLLPQRILGDADFKEALHGKLGKFKQWLDRYAKETQPERQPVNVTTPLLSESVLGPEPTSKELVGMGGAVASEFELSAKTPTSIKNAQVDIERAKRGLPEVVQPARRSFGEVWDSAMARIDNDPSYPDRLINELRENPRALTDLEDATLLHRQVDLQNEYGKATRALAQAFDDGRMEDVALEKAKVDFISNQLLDLYNIGKKVGTETGRGLSARRMMANEDFTLASLELQKRAAKGGKPLTDVERAELSKIADEYRVRNEALEKHLAEKDQRIAELEANKVIDEVVREPKGQKEPSPKDAAESREAIGESIKGKVASGEPHDISGLVQKLARTFVEQGIRNRDQLIDAVHAELKAYIPEITRRETMDAISGYGKFKQLTKDEISVQLRDLKGQMQQVAKLEDMQSGQAPKKTGVERRIPSDEERRLIKQVEEAKKKGGYQVTDPATQLRTAMQAVKTRLTNQIADLEKQIETREKIVKKRTRLEYDAEASKLRARRDELKKQFDEVFGKPELTDAQRLQMWKTRTSRRIADLQDRVDKGNFAKKTPREIKFDQEALRLKYQLELVKRQWYEGLMKDRLANRTVPQKVMAGLGEVVNTFRAIMTSFDLSAVLRQGGFVVMGHPIRAAKVFPAMLRALRSKEGQFKVDQEILQRPNYPLYEQSKLYLSEHGQKLSQMEEAYMSRWAEKIPGVGASQRAYTTFLNKLRADSFDAMARTLSRSGELTPNEAKAIANFINVATGRGNLGMKENALVGLNTVFFAPRYVASRFQLITGQPLYQGTARTRALIASEYARYLIGVAAVYALATLDGADIETDPRSSDFGKLRYGETRLDPLSGLQQVTVITTRLATGETTNLKGKTIPIRGEDVPYGGSDAADVIARFLRTKLAPLPGAIVNLLSQENVVGQPVTPQSTATDLLVPLAFRDIYKAMLEQGIPRGTAFGILSLFGMGLQTYDQQ